MALGDSDLFNNCIEYKVNIILKRNKIKLRLFTLGENYKLHKTILTNKFINSS